ncbi:MAG TPA: hypothetical protein VE685_01155 [Thermoanaerobaculia bacterium]|nr:hypothetical protein [Thermoanaerobaculia bacterium]
MPGISFARTVSDCELMKAALEPLLGEMPHLAAEHEELGAFLDHVRELGRQQEDLKGQLRQMTRLRQEAERQGQDLRSRVAAQLRGKLGFKNETLLRFGVPPRRQRRRTSEETVKRPAAAPAPTAGTPEEAPQ